MSNWVSVDVSEDMKVWNQNSSNVPNFSNAPKPNVRQAGTVKLLNGECTMLKHNNKKNTCYFTALYETSLFVKTNSPLTTLKINWPLKETNSHYQSSNFTKQCLADIPPKLVREIDAFTHFAANDTAQESTILLWGFVVSMLLHTHQQPQNMCTRNAHYPTIQP